MKKIFIYKIENKTNGRIYIGSTENYKVRYYKHLGMLRRNSHSNNELQEDYNKYVIDEFDFSILCECFVNDDERYLIEEIYTEKYSDCKLYNYFYGSKPSKKEKERMSKRFKGENNPMYNRETWMKGKKHSLESRLKISKANKGRKRTEEQKQIQSEKMKGENAPWYGKTIPDEVRKKISETLTGNKLSEETKSKISNTLKGRKHSEETKIRIAQGNSGKKFSEERKKNISEARKKKLAEETILMIDNLYYVNKFNITQISRITGIGVKIIRRILTT